MQARKAPVTKGGAAKLVYFFGGGKADGNAGMKNLLGGKGANLAEMAALGLPVPPGFTVTTEVCTHYYANGKRFPEALGAQVGAALARVEQIVGCRFGDPENPLLVSVRSGARSSMPGMMETVLNVGLTSATIPGMIAKTKNPRFVYDAYRRLIMMYADVVMEKAAGIEPADDRGVRKQLEHLMDELKLRRGYKSDTDITAAELEALCEAFKAKVREVLGAEFPDTAPAQLWGGIGAVFQSWNGKRAISYRKIEGIPESWGTAVNVQAMVFGNMGDDCATGVAFTRDPGTGENGFFGEWLVNAQGEDVVAGIRTPYAINEHATNDQNRHLPTLERTMPKLYEELVRIRAKLERHYRNMQDLEFTIQNGRLYMLQTRDGKRNGPAALRMAVEMCQERLIDRATAVGRVKPSQLDELYHPMVDPAREKEFKVLTKGLPAGPGGAVGQIVLTADKAAAWAKEGRKVILVRHETSPEDVHGMHAAEAILTAKGGMTSHAALVARGWGKCCVVGAGAVSINLAAGTITVGEQVLHEGDTITLNGTKGVVYAGTLPLITPDPEKNEQLQEFLRWCDGIRTLGVRTNADTPADAAQARRFGAAGIGLCRTEHMFFGEERIRAMREMILAETPAERETAVFKLLPFQKEDFKGILRAMAGLPVTIRLLDPPLHEFVPHEPHLVQELARGMGKDVAKVEARIAQLKELNPMLGHRGCRLGVTYPEITRMQALAILEATAELIAEGVDARPEIMVPLVGNVRELTNQKDVIMKAAEEVRQRAGVKRLPFTVGTMIEVPRAAVTADEIAAEAEFFSFGTNDLTQMGGGFSRDDAGSFLPSYVEKKIYAEDPFISLDTAGIGKLMRIGVQLGRGARPGLKIGICGEHGGDPPSIAFCHEIGLNYVSCSPFRVPIARLAAAQAQVANPRGAKAAAKKAAPAKKTGTTKAGAKAVAARTAAPPKPTAKAAAKKKAPVRKAGPKKAVKKAAAKKPARRR
ncbi:MAG TPA: pyruvate, phosphate dikinase [bacterium]